MPLRLMDEIAAFKIGIVDFPKEPERDIHPSCRVECASARASHAPLLSIRKSSFSTAHRGARPDSGWRLRRIDSGLEG